jgi:opacity protein-like surface antigen
LPAARHAALPQFELPTYNQTVITWSDRNVTIALTPRRCIMRWKLMILSVMASMFLGAASPAKAQVTYSAEEGKLPFTIGMGVSSFSDDWGVSNPRQLGINLWADWRFRLPPVLQGLGVEFEGRDVNYNTPSGIAGHRMDTALIGPLYQWRKNDRFRPYGKYLIGIGSIDYPSPGLLQSHDTATVFEPGGGLDARVWNRLSIRAEYDYQFWHHLFGPNDLTPTGLSVGAVYDFGRASQ